MDHWQTPSSGTHPVLTCAARIEEALKDAAGSDPIFMSTSEKRGALLALTAQQNQLEALRLRVIAASDDVAAEDGDRSVGAWLAFRTLTDTKPNYRDERFAVSLARDWTELGDAVSQGEVNVAQARVIAYCLDELATADIDAPTLSGAETALVRLAGEWGPHHLRILGRRILATLAPDRFDEAERKKLEEEERRAHARAKVWFRRNGDGTVDVRATLSEVGAQRLKTALNSLTSPRHNDNDPAGGTAPLVDPATGRKVPHDQRQGLALEALLERLDPEALPKTAGSGTKLVITMDFDKLREGVGSGTLPDGEQVSASQVRRLACEADLIPAVLGADGEVLDLGRSSRLFTGKQKLAMAIQQRTCRAVGCEVPATWCEAHHDDPWSSGGKTDLRDGVLLCPWHHHRVHDPVFAHERLPDGDYRFHRRT